MRSLAALTAVCLSVCAPVAQADENGSLFDGEHLVEAAGFPAVTKYVAGDPDKPLIVFVPGTNHMARIAYGGHDGAHPEDFLAYWLHEKGYGFLGVSYPIDTASKVMPRLAPEFTTTDWGRQAMELAKSTISENDLNGEVILVAWSMAGKIPAAAQIAAKDLGVDLSLYVALSGTAAIPGLLSYDRKFDMLESGYADRRKYWDGWHKQIEAMSAGATHETIPEDIYLNDYVGDVAVGLEGFIQRYEDGAYVGDYIATTNDNGAFEYGQYPLVGVVAPAGKVDSRHAVTDNAVWNFYNANTIYHRYVRNAVPKLAEIDDARWQGVLDLTDSASQRLSRRVPGNHFFFVGESGALATANAIESLDRSSDAFKAELGRLLGADLSAY